MKRKFNYVYVIIVLCFLFVGLTLGFCSNSKSMYLTAVTEALGFSRGAFSVNDTFRYVATSVVTLFFGVLVSKFGTKKLLLSGVAALIACMLVSAYATTLTGFYVAGALLGAGFSFTSTSMASVVINKWCTKNKGTVTGIVFASNGLCGAIAAQILSPIIYKEGNPFGYRDSYKLVAVIFVVLFVLLLVFFRDAPKNQIKAAPSGKKKARGTGWVGMEFSDATKKPYFYASIVCMLLAGMSLQSVYTFATPHLYDIGLSKPFVATLLTISSLGLLCSKFLTGFLFDRFGMKLTMNICYTCSFLSLVFLMLTSNTPFGRVIAVACKIVEAFALPLETVMLPLFASELFGNKSFDKTIGFFVSANYAGYAIGSPIANFWYDKTGSYIAPMIFFLSILVVVAFTMNFILRIANRDKRAICKQTEQ